MMAEMIQNTQSEWKKLSKALISGTKQMDEITVCVGTSDQETGDVTMLRYFFPLVSALKANEIWPDDRKAKLNIRIKPVNESNQDMVERVKAFLAATSDLGEYQFAINNSLYSNGTEGWQGSSIFPVYEVSADGTGNGHYMTLLKM